MALYEGTGADYDNVVIPRAPYAVRQHGTDNQTFAVGTTLVPVGNILGLVRNRFWFKKISGGTVTSATLQSWNSTEQGWEDIGVAVVDDTETNYDISDHEICRLEVVIATTPVVASWWMHLTDTT